MKVNDSNVIIPDVQACNGVIHVIDAVLIPTTPELIDENTWFCGESWDWVESNCDKALRE